MSYELALDSKRTLFASGELSVVTETNVVGRYLGIHDGTVYLITATEGVGIKTDIVATSAPMTPYDIKMAGDSTTHGIMAFRWGETIPDTTRTLTQWGLCGFRITETGVTYGALLIMPESHDDLYYRNSLGTPAVGGAVINDLWSACYYVQGGGTGQVDYFSYPAAVNETTLEVSVGAKYIYHSTSGTPNWKFDPWYTQELPGQRSIAPRHYSYSGNNAKYLINFVKVDGNWQWGAALTLKTWNPGQSGTSYGAFKHESVVEPTSTAGGYVITTYIQTNLDNIPRPRAQVSTLAEDGTMADALGELVYAGSTTNAMTISPWTMTNQTASTMAGIAYADDAVVILRHFAFGDTISSVAHPTELPASDVTGGFRVLVASNHMAGLIWKDAAGAWVIAPWKNHYSPSTYKAEEGGPIILAEIDAEDHGQDWSGPLTYICDNVVKHGRTTGLNLLVLGATGSSANWYQNLANTTGRFASVDFVTGTSIQTIAFGSYDVIGLPSTSGQTSGGISRTDEGYVNGRSDAFTNHINSGGGVLAFTWEGSTAPYLFLGGVASFGVSYYVYDRITPTQAGLDIGITTALNVYAWHGVFTAWPDFMDVLAYDEGTTSPAAIGGKKVIVSSGVDSPLRVRGRDDPNTYGTPRVTLGNTQSTSHQYSQRVRLGGSVYS